MRLPPLFEERSERVQAGLVLGGPILFGIVCGILLGISGPVYLIVSLFGIAGGYFAGLEHTEVREGILRGLVGGALFAGSILFTHSVLGADAEANLPDPPALIMPIFAVIGAVLGALGARARRRREATRPT
jgi:hypothetical protein